jgi:hypothetical protein
MSKSLLNLLLQISKALVYSKIKSLFGKEFPFTFGPIGPVASRPIRPFSPVVAHLPSPPCRPTGQPAQWPSTGPPGFSLPSLTDVRAPLVIFFPEPAAEHCCPSRPGRASPGRCPAPAPRREANPSRSLPLPLLYWPPPPPPLPIASAPPIR